MVGDELKRSNRELDMTALAGTSVRPKVSAARYEEEIDKPRCDHRAKPVTRRGEQWPVDQFTLVDRGTRGSQAQGADRLPAAKADCFHRQCRIHERQIAHAVGPDATVHRFKARCRVGRDRFGWWRLFRLKGGLVNTAGHGWPSPADGSLPRSAKCREES